MTFQENLIDLSVFVGDVAFIALAFGGVLLAAVTAVIAVDPRDMTKSTAAFRIAIGVLMVAAGIVGLAGCKTYHDWRASADYRTGKLDR